MHLSAGTGTNNATDSARPPGHLFKDDEAGDGKEQAPRYTYPDVHGLQPPEGQAPRYTYPDAPVLQPPATVRVGGRLRDIVTGGGLCDPGRCDPTNRPKGKLSSLAPGIMDILTRHDLPGKLRDAVLRRSKESPFSETAISEGRTWLMTQANLLVGSSGPQADLEVSESQPFLLNLMHTLAFLAGDPDAAYPLQCASGHNIGVVEPIAPTPRVFPQKGSGNIDADTVPPMEENLPNYPSALENEAHIRRVYHEDQSLGMTVGPLSAFGAMELCGSRELYNGPLGTKDEPKPSDPDNKRTVQNGTSTGVNPRIQQNIQDQAQCPSLCDARHGMSINRKSKGTAFGFLKADVKKAHRREKIRRKDWKYAVSKLGSDEYYVHKCGVYGIASAHVYWARKAALLVRLLWAFIEDDDTLWIFIYVDDFLFLINIHRFWAQAAFLLYMLCVLGTPFSWQKMAAGMQVSWIGFDLHSKLGATGIPDDKRRVLIELLQRTRQRALVSRAEFKSIPHKLSWATTALEHLRPLLQPLFAFLHAFIKDKMAVPGLVQVCLEFYIRQLCDAPLYQSVEFRHRLHCWGSTDAAGKRGGRRCGIGGWFCTGDAIRAKAHWFTFLFVPETLPWAFDRDEDSSRRISALELLGTAVYIKMVAAVLALRPTAGPPLTPRGVQVIIPGCTDNQGNKHALARLYTKRWPGAAVLMEIAHDIVQFDLALDVEFAGRDDNRWADALANGRSDGFDPSLQYSPDISADEFWHLLPQVLRMGADMGMHLGAKQKRRACAPTAQHFAPPPVAELLAPTRGRG